MKSLLKACLSIFASLLYCHGVGKTVSKGIKRLVLVLPIVFLFLYLPLNFSSINCGGIIGFFISWLANFKLLLFAFGKGPLSSHQYVSLKRFIAYACLPIDTPKNPSKRPKKAQRNDYSKWLVIYATKCLLLAILVLLLPRYKPHVHEKVILFSYSLYIYLVLDVLLAATSTVARAVWGAELEPHFVEPYLATSLQDFWGRRWNLAVHRVLHPTIYEPSLWAWAHIVGRRWAVVPSIMSSFVVSGLMHELIYYYWARVWPTWEVTTFFLIHGACLTVEIVLKKLLSSSRGGGVYTWRLPRVLTGPLTVVFVMYTCFCFMFPQIIRCEGDTRLLREYAAIGGFFKNVIDKLPLSITA